ncbi:hypothetical protein [Natronocalculus amylovorans]|uniref:Uncharacterized protein n=1 Tax=Natronocalculus amylovorans TaxID=2917812 RepID=A0AAE3K9Z5_9EURY|nr:hypothetical protein [Natronocalculus amylovorans]MCL9818546.1 hypothetical protein [Natronocalculus amylovorans]
MTTKTSTNVTASIGDLGFRWYHAGFALAAGVGLGILPPAGAQTIAEWLGSALGWLLVGFLLVGIITAIVRWRDEWRPEAILPEAPDSRLKYAVFGAIGLQLFVLGTLWAAGARAETMVYASIPMNILIAGTVLGDAITLERRGIEWKLTMFAYPLAALLFGFVGGLVYWNHRGRTRAE